MKKFNWSMNIKSLLSIENGSDSIEAISVNDAGAGTSIEPNGNHAALTHEQLKLRNALLFVREHLDVRSVLLTGLHEGAGVTSVAIALARGLSWDLRSKVLLIEANIYKPRLRQFFDSFRNEDATPALEVVPHLLDMAMPVDPPNLEVITADHSNHRIMLEPKRVAAAMPALRELYDFVVVDAPPVSSHPEILVLSSQFDSVALVVEAGHTNIKELQKIIIALHQAKGKLLGVVLNREKPSLPTILENWL